jgi:hypothetical protein
VNISQYFRFVSLPSFLSSNSLNTNQRGRLTSPHRTWLLGDLVALEGRFCSGWQTEEQSN